MKRFLLFLAICFFLTGFAAAQSEQIKYAIIPENPQPGEPVTIGAAGGLTRALLFSGGRQLASAGFFLVPASGGDPGFIAAILTVPSLAASGAAMIRLEGAAGVVEIPLIIARREFVSEVIHLNPVLTGIRTEPDPQKYIEANRLTTILNTVGNEIYYTGIFNPPVWSTRRTSFFGDRRVFEYSNGGRETSIHAGVDFGVPTGTQIVSCGRGRVVFAAMRINTGNSVIIEHLPGVYSIYYHLSTIRVREGDIVDRGILLGQAGSTGLATGPHLHWELRVNRENTDPDFWTTRPIIDKKEILSRIGN